MSKPKKPTLTPEATDAAGAVMLSGYSLSTVKRASAWGHLKSHVVGNRRRYFVKDIRAWMAWLAEESDMGKPVNYTGRNAPLPPPMSVRCPQGKVTSRAAVVTVRK